VQGPSGGHVRASVHRPGRHGQPRLIDTDVDARRHGDTNPLVPGPGALGDINAGGIGDANARALGDISDTSASAIGDINGSVIGDANAGTFGVISIGVIGIGVIGNTSTGINGGASTGTIGDRESRACRHGDAGSPAERSRLLDAGARARPDAHRASVGYAGAGPEHCRDTTSGPFHALRER
jgi:hypothetical protein